MTRDTFFSGSSATAARARRATFVAAFAWLIACAVQPAAHLAARSAPDAAAAPRIVAIGDVHGNADGLAAILQRAQLIDDAHHWVGGATTLVQLGDIFDRGPQVRAALDLIMALEAEAPQAGGKVVALLGNHEMMNLVGDLHDTPPETYASFADDQSEERRAKAYDAYVKLCKAQSGAGQTHDAYALPDRDQWMAAHPPGFIEYREALRPEGRYGKWLRARAAVVQIGETLFLHGGISDEASHLKPEALSKQIQKEIKSFDGYRQYLVDQNLAMPWFTLPELLRVVQAQLTRIAGQTLRTTGGGGGAALQDDVDPRLVEVLQGMGRMPTWYSIKADGPLWFRGYAMWKTTEGRQAIVPIIRQLGVKHIVVGHTIPSTMSITRRFNGQVILIDTGMLTSYYPGGRPSALEIQDAQFRALYLDETIILLQTNTLTLPEIEDIP